MKQLWIAAAVMLFASAAGAQNLALNPTFDSDIQAWSSPTASISWHDLDSLDLATSGSLKATFTGAVVNAGAHVSQCVAVTGGTRYAVGAKVMIPGNQPRGAAAVYVYYYDSTDCSGSSTNMGGSGGMFEVSNGAFTAINNGGITAPPATHSARIDLAFSCLEPGTITAYFDDVRLVRSSECVPDIHILCLDGNRFQVSAFYSVGTGPFTIAHGVQLTSDSGYFWFFDKNNVELIVKVLDATVVNNRHWVFSAGTTNVGVILKVTDTTTGEFHTYTNSSDHVYEAVLDTSAFLP